MSRSRQLVHGHGWRVFSVLIVTLLLVFVASTLLVSLAGGDRVAIAIASLIARTLTAPIFALASAVLYLELLELKGEPLPPADMAGFSGRT
jgi:hypothetical protein